MDFGAFCAWYSMMLNIISGFLLEVMMVVTPAAVAISAAISFVSIPPVPRLDPSVVVLTAESISANVAQMLLHNRKRTFSPNGRYRIHDFYLLSIWILPWIRSVKTIHIREEEQVVCMNHR